MRWKNHDLAVAFLNVCACCLILLIPLNLGFEFKAVTPMNGPTSGGLIITAWGALLSTNSWNECNSPGAGFEVSTPSATFYPSLFFENKESEVTQKQWITFAKDCSISGGFSVFTLPALSLGAYSGVLWYQVKTDVAMPRGMQSALSLPFSYDLPTITNLTFAQPVARGGLLTIFGRNFRATSNPLSVMVGSSSCIGASLVHPHTSFKCVIKPFANGPSSRLNVSVVFHSEASYVWSGFSFGDVRGIVRPTPLSFQNALSGAVVIFPFASQSLGVRSTSLFASIHASSCTFSAWFSDTSLTCKHPSGFVLPSNSSLRVSIASTGNYRFQSTFFTQNPSCQFLQILQTKDGAFRSTTGSNFVSFVAGGLGSYGNSVQNRVDGTFCDSSLWISDSSVTSKIHPSTKQSSTVVATMLSLATVCPSARNILLLNVSGNVSTLCAPTTGSYVVNLHGMNMGSIGNSFKLRLESTATMVTRWISDSVIISKMSTRVTSLYELPMFSSISHAVSNSSVMLPRILLSSNVTVNLSSSLTLFFPTTGNLLVFLMLSSAGNVDASSSISQHFSACQASKWKSESTIICKSGLSSISLNFITVSMLFFKYDLKMSLPLKLAIANTNVSRPFDVASTGSGKIVEFQCQNLGTLSFSRSIRLHQSACQISSWISESSIICKPSLVSNLFEAIVISGYNSFSSTNATNAGTFSVFGNTTNTPYTGSGVLSIFGFGFLSHDFSARVRVATTACDITVWRSHSSINAKIPRGKGLFGVSVSLQRNWRDSATSDHAFDFEDFSFVPSFYNFTQSLHYPLTGGLELNLIGFSASNEDQSGAARMSASAYVFSKWISWTSLMCKTSNGGWVSAPTTFVSYGLLVDVRNANLPLPAFEIILKASLRNLPTTGSLILQTLGANFETYDSCLSIRVSETAQEFTFWIAHSSIIAHSTGSVGRSELILASLTEKRSNVLNLAFNNVFVTSSSKISPQLALPTSGSTNIIFHGKSMGKFGTSAAARIRLSSCNELSWTSDSAIVCKVAAGSGGSQLVHVSQKCRTVSFSNSQALKTAYSFPIMKNFSVSTSNPSSIILHGSNLATFDFDVSSVSGFNEALVIGPDKSQILLSSSALLQGKSVRDIQVQIEIKSSRLDDVILSLETSPFVGRILLLKSQCFGCSAKSDDKNLIFVFSDRALKQPPTSECSSGMYLPSIPFSTLFTYSGNLSLQFTSGSTISTIFSASVTVVQSEVNIVADETFSSLNIKWYSDSALEFKFPAILGINNTFQVIVDSQISSKIAGLHYPIPVVRRPGKPQVIPGTGSLFALIYGTFFGQRMHTLRMRMGRSACPSSVWISDEAISGKSSRGLSVPDMWIFSATVTRQVSKAQTLVVENESPELITADMTYGSLSTGNVLLFSSGSRFGSSQYSPLLRFSKSASTFTFWISDSSICSMVATKSKSEVKIIVSISRLSSTSGFSVALSETIQLYLTNTCVPRSGSSRIILTGMGFMPISLSSQVRIGQSGATGTLWRSDSCIFSQVPRIGLGARLGVYVTVPIWEQTAFAPDSVRIRVPSTQLYGSFTLQNRTTTSSWQIYSLLILQGQDFGFFESNIFKSLSIDPNIGCDSSNWISDSSFSAACRVNPPGSEVVFRMSTLQSVQNDQTFQGRFLSSVNVAGIIGPSAHASNLPTSGNVILSVSGKDFSSVYGVISKVSYTACSESTWLSGTSMTCRVPSGIGFSLSFSVSSIKKISQSISEFLDHMHPTISATPASKTPASGSVEVISIAANLGSSDFSCRVRLAHSSIAAHRWFSDTFMSMKTPSVTMLQGVNLVISSGMMPSLSSNSQVLDSPFLRLNVTLGKISASSATAFLVISGERLGTSRMSQAARIQATACSANIWISDSVVSCKISYGVGFVDLMILSGSVNKPSPIVQTLKQAVYQTSVLRSLKRSKFSILFEGNHFGQASPTDQTSSQIFNIQVPSNSERVILSSTALMEQIAILSITVSVTMSRISRLDDVVLFLEVFRSKNDAVPTRIILFQNQCFGCVFGPSSSITFDFDDTAAATIPLNNCGPNGLYRPKHMTFESIYDFSGIINLKVISGSNAIEFPKASIVALRSNLNVFFFRIIDKNVTEVVTSKSISWTSDSAFSSTFPATVGKNISVQGMMYQQNSNFLHGFEYPPVEFFDMFRTFPSSGSSLVSLSGLFFGQIDSSPRVRVGSSSCAGTAWISDFAVICKRLAPGQDYEKLNFQASVTKNIGGNWSQSHYDSRFSTNIFSAKLSTGSIVLSAAFFGTGVYDPTAKLRSSRSSAILTYWISDSAIRSLTPFRGRNTFVSASINSVVAAIPVNVLKKLSYSQTPFEIVVARTASNLVAIQGNEFGSFGHCAKARTMNTDCQSSSWIGDSAIICRIPQAFLIGAKALSVSADNVIIQLSLINDVYGKPSPFGDSKIELEPFHPANGSISLLEQLKFSSTGSNYGFATKLRVGSTLCREIMWSSQSSVACSMHCPIPYNEPFLAIGMQHDDDIMSVNTVNKGYLPVKYSLESSIMTSISTPSASVFEPSAWAITTFKTFQRFDISFHFFNNNSEPFMYFFTDEIGVQRYLRVPIFITVKIETQHFGSQSGQILCEDSELMNTIILAGGKSANVKFTNGICEQSEKMRFAYSICMTSDENQKSLFAAGRRENTVLSNTTYLFLQSPWVSAPLFVPFFAADSIIDAPLVVAAGSIVSKLPVFELKTRTFCSDTFVLLYIRMICSQGFVMFSIDNSAVALEHRRILKFSCFFVMPDWYAVTADKTCNIRIVINNNNMQSDSSSFSVIPSHVAKIKSANLLRNVYTSGDIIANIQSVLCYVASVHDNFDNLITDASRFAELSAFHTNEGRNMTYVLNGTLRAQLKSNGMVEWCDVQATRITQHAYLALRVTPVNSLDTNNTFTFQSFAVRNVGKAALSSIFMPNSTVISNDFVVARDFKIPTFSVQIEDSFRNSLSYDPRLIMRISIQSAMDVSRSRKLLVSDYTTHFDHLHSTPIVEAARASGCLDYQNFTFYSINQLATENRNSSIFDFNDLRVCEKGQYSLTMDVGFAIGAPGSAIFSSSASSIASVSFEVVPGAPFRINLVGVSSETSIKIRTYSYMDKMLSVEILDWGFNIVNGTASLSLDSNSGMFQVTPASIQISGDICMLSGIWISAYDNFKNMNVQEAFKISSSTLKIIRSNVKVEVGLTCSPGTYLDRLDSLPSSLKCTSCETGWFSSGWDSKTCSICSPGTFAAQDASSCIPCPDGYATNSAGSPSCRKCSAFYYSNKLGTECFSLMFVTKPNFNVIPFVITTIPPVQLYDELSKQLRHSVQVQIKVVCLLRFNCTYKSNIDGFEIFSKDIQIPTDHRASQSDSFFVESLCGSSILGSNFRWLIKLQSSNIYPSIEIYDDVNILINKCQPSIETIDPPEPKPKSSFGITLTETVTLVGVDFGIQPAVLRLLPGYPELSPHLCIFSCRLKSTNEIVHSSSTMVQNMNLIDTFECPTNFTTGMKIGDSITLDVVLLDGRSSSSKIQLHTICPSMYYLSENNAAHGCEECPHPQSLSRGSNQPSAEYCLCNQGYYGTFGLNCLSCPEDHPGFDCVNFGSRWPKIKAGYYIEYSRMSDCTSKDNCNAVTECLYSWACPGDSELSCLGSVGQDTCYEGKGCYKCCPRYYMDDENMCINCPSEVFSYTILACALLAPFILAALAQAAMTPARKVAMQGVLQLVDFFQSISNVSVVKIPWPSFLDASFNFLKFFAFGLSSVREECSVNLNPITKLFLMASLPFALSLVMSALTAHKCYTTLKDIRTKIDKLPQKHKFLSIQKNNNMLCLSRCLMMDVFSLHPGYVPNSFFSALSVTIKERHENVIRMSAVLPISSQKVVSELKRHKFGHRGMLFMPHDTHEVADLLRVCGVQQSFLQCSILVRQRISAILSIFVLTLQGTLSALLSTFRCTPLNDQMVLLSNPEIVCDTSVDATYQGMFVVSLAGCLWCGFMTPIIMLIVLKSKWCRLFALRHLESYQEMFNCLVDGIRSTNYLCIPGLLIRTSLSLCVVIFIEGPARQLLAQILFNFMELTYLLVVRPFLVQISNDIEQVNSMANFVVILSGLLFIAQVDGQAALQESSRNLLGMLVLAVLVISTFIMVTKVTIDVFSNLVLESTSALAFWWKAFVAFLNEGTLAQLSGFFFGLQMAQYSSLTVHAVRETTRSQKKELYEKLVEVETNMNDKYLNTEGSYFRSPLLMNFLHKQAVRRTREAQKKKDSSFTGNVADLKKITDLAEIKSVGSIHQILFNKHPERINDNDPPHHYKLFALESIKAVDCFVNKSQQNILLAQLLLANEGVGSLGMDSVEYSNAISAKWKTMQKVIVRASGTLLTLTDFDNTRIKKWPWIFRPLQFLAFQWNMGLDTLHQYNLLTQSTTNSQSFKPIFGNLSSVFQAKKFIRRSKVGMSDLATQEEELQDNWNENTSNDKPKWGLLRGQLLVETLLATESSMPTMPTPRENLLKNTISIIRKRPDSKPFQSGGFKLSAADNRLTNVPASYNWIIEYSVVKSQWQLKHLEDKGKDTYVAFLDTTLVLSRCCNASDWHLWNGDPHHRKYNIQSSVLVEIISPGKPDAKSVRLKGFFARLRADVEGESIFWQFASHLNGDYENLGLVSNNRFVYFNSFAAETYLAAEKERNSELQAARFGHAAPQASLIVGRRVISSKRFINPSTTAKPSLKTQSKPLPAAVSDVLSPGAVFANDSGGETVKAMMASENWSDTSGDELNKDKDEWSKSSASQ